MGFDAPALAILTEWNRPPKAPATRPRLRRLAMIGNFPPRKCGIATFTRDTYSSLKARLPDAHWDIVALNDPGASYDYPPDVTQVLPQNDAAAYVRVADALNESGVEVVFIQHEFGIFGGDAGAHLLQLMRRLHAPAVVTLHTVLEHPDPAQKRVLDEIIQLAAGVIVMTEKGADIIERVHHVGPSKVHVIPHGAPERPFASTEPFKAKLGFAGRKLIMTFGLLSPNKGIETIIRALPDVLDRHPDALYLVVGATHPHLIAREGEAYRESLVKLAASLGVAGNLTFINRFVGDAELVDLLQAADIYATPYLHEAQVTSGTLSYAVALGKPVISTPYWHAAEALADDVGVLCDFGDSKCFGRALEHLLSSPSAREAMARRAYKAGESSRWRKVAGAWLDLAVACRDASRKRESASVRALLRPGLAAIHRITDDCGVLQHSKFRVPDRRHGYCTDDNARALSLFSRLSHEGDNGDPDSRLAYTCAAFVNHAWNPDNGRFRNFMGYDRRWLDDGGSDDCCARAFEALCLTGNHAGRPDLRLWANDLAKAVASHAREWRSIRSRALVVKACLNGEGTILDRDEARALIGESAETMMAALAAQRSAGGEWFEAGLTYDNARLPEALILAGGHLDRPDWTEAGLTTLGYLMRKQRSAQGWFSPVATNSFDANSASHPSFDQQPIEALATVDACIAAYHATGDDVWSGRAEAAFLWFSGQNDHGLALVTAADGGCYDGLTAFGFNQNQGAESILSYHLAAAAIRGVSHLQRTIS
jgi:glycosyltransferase involved in cell wall biosynthesis